MAEMWRDNRRLLAFIIVSNFILNLGFTVWQTLFNNFAVEEIGIGPTEVGLVQAVREIPGLLGFALGFLALFMSEIRIMTISIILLGIGIFFTGQADGLTLLLLTTFVMSLGFHFFVPPSNAVVLMAMKQEDTPKTLGSLAAFGSFASLVGTGIVYLLAGPAGYRNLYFAVGAFAVVGGIALLPFKGSGHSLPAGRKVVIRRRYWLYYTLSFLLGSRRHIFTTFAIFLLVREFDVPVQTVAILVMINSLVNVFTLRWTAQLVGRIGERLALTIAFATLALVFLGYAYLSALPVLYAMYILDNILFGFNVALPLYFQKIAVSREEITSNLATEQAIQHIAAIIVPIIGGAVWVAFGRQAPFLFGAFVVLIALALVQKMRVDIPPLPAPLEGN